MNNDGFSLLSVLVYILCSTILVLSIFHSIARFFVPSIQSMLMYRKQIDLHIMADLFVKDIRALPVIKWKKKSEQVAQWKNGTSDICWIYKDGILRRIQGTYKKKKWHTQTTSIVGTHIKDVSFYYDDDQGKTVGAEIILTSSVCPEKPVSGYVAMR